MAMPLWEPMEQVFAVTGDDQLGARRDRSSYHMIVIGIVGYHARHAGGHNQRHQRRVLRHQRHNIGAEAGDACREFRVTERMRQFVKQHRAAE